MRRAGRLRTVMGEYLPPAKIIPVGCPRAPVPQSAADALLIQLLLLDSEILNGCCWEGLAAAQPIVLHHFFVSQKLNNSSPLPQAASIIEQVSDAELIKSANLLPIRALTFRASFSFFNSIVIQLISCIIDE